MTQYITNLETAFHLNEAGLHLDGIERIENDDSVYFADPFSRVVHRGCGP